MGTVFLSCDSWLAYSDANAPTLASAAIFDTLGATLSGGTFGWNAVGNDVFLSYSVPEPGSLGLLLAGLPLLGLRRRRRG